MYVSYYYFLLVTEELVAVLFAASELLGYLAICSAL